MSSSSGPTARVDHVTVATDDFDASRPVYDAVLGALGFEHFVEYEDPEEEDGDPGTVKAIGYALPGGRPHFWLVAGLTPTRGAHTAFAVADGDLVDAAFEAARDTGAKVVQPPRRWEATHLNYYGMQVADPNGNLLEVVRRPPS